MQLNKVVAAVHDKPGADVIPVAMKLLDKEELKLARAFVLKCCFIFAQIYCLLIAEPFIS